jgi:hypothetical protein
VGIGNYAKVGSEAASLRNDWELGLSIKRCSSLKIFGRRKNNQVLAPIQIPKTD